jgi:aspartate 1-decarboxylase
VGSITLDPRLMDLADIREFEQVHVLDIDNGNRLETYAISGGPGDVCLNGAAARLVQPGDKVIVISYADYEEAELEGYEPRVVHVDTENRPVSQELAARIAADTAGPGPIRYREIEAEVNRGIAAFEAGLDELR